MKLPSVSVVRHASNVQLSDFVNPNFQEVNEDAAGPTNVAAVPVSSVGDVGLNVATSELLPRVRLCGKMFCLGCII